MWVMSMEMAEFGLLHFSAVFTCFFYIYILLFSEDQFSVLFACLTFWTPTCIPSTVTRERKGNMRMKHGLGHGREDQGFRLKLDALTRVGVRVKPRSRWVQMGRVDLPNCDHLSDSSIAEGGEKKLFNKEN